MALIKKYQNSFTSGVLSPGVLARVDLSKYADGCQEMVNCVIYAHGGVTNRPGTLYVDTLPGDGLLIPFVYSVTQTYVLAFFDKGNGKAFMRVYKEGGVVLKDGKVFEIETPYAPAELSAIKFAQSADVMFLVHPAHRPQKLTRQGHANWTFSEMLFKPSISAPTGLKATASGFEDDSDTYYETTIQYKVSAVNDREVESVPSAAVSVKALSTWPNKAKVELSWAAVEGAVRYEVYKDVRGWYEWIGSADSTSFKDDNIEGDSGTGPKENRDPFAAAGDYPGVVGIYQQRLVFGRSNNEPQTVWMSETGSFDSMAVAQPLRDDSAITATVDSKQMNEIRHFIPLRDMLMLTSGAEFKIRSGDTSGAVTPTSLRFDIQSYWGSSNVPPIVSGTSILMAQNSGKAVRDLHYQLSEDGYAGNEVSILAEHLLDSPIRDWAYQQDPFSTVWICLESGKLLTFTYMREQEIWAWSEHESDGIFRSVSSIREGADDSVYFLTKRGDSYFVEYQQRRNYGDDIRDAFFVDCGLQYRGALTSRITGLEHLAGREIAVLADGSVVRGVKVGDDGSFELPFPAQRVSAGLPYRMSIRTVDPEIRSEQGSVAGDNKNVVRAIFRVRETRGLWAGPSKDKMLMVKQEPPEKWGDPPPLTDGEVVLPLPGKHGSSCSIYIEQRDPLPATLLALTTWISVG